MRSKGDLYRFEYAMTDWVWTDSRLTNPSSQDWTHFELAGDPQSKEKGLVVKMSHLPWF